MTHERELRLKGDELSRLYAEAPQIDPPEHLDAAILAEAHRAVNAKPVGRHKRRWAVPLGLAASLFVMVMVGLQLPYMLQEPSLQQAPLPADAASRMDMPVAAQALEKKASSGELRAKAKSTNRIADSQPAAPLAPMPSPAPAFAPAPVMAETPLEVGDRTESANVGALVKEKVIGNNDELKQPAPAATAPPPAKLERALLKDEADAAVPPPEEWLKRIGKLKREGKMQEAAKELEAFRKRYPAFPVPAGFK